MSTGQPGRSAGAQAPQPVGEPATPARAGLPAQRIAVLISGRGSNLRALVEHSLRSAASYRVTHVLSDRHDAGGLAFARDYGIAAHTIAAAVDPAADKSAQRLSYDRSLAAAIEECAPTLIVLAGFMRVLSAEFVERYAGRIVNIHPSLLPKYPGLHTHRRVLAAGEVEHGATVHFVTAELDGGPPIVQARVPVRPGDDEAALAARVLAQEHRIYPLSVDWYCTGRLRCREGRAWLDGERLDRPVDYASPVAVS